MKKVNIFLSILLLAGCGGNRQVYESDGFITVDVTASYPKKELILQDFMDVEYIPLETGGEFFTQGIVKAIGKDIIIVTNQLRDGDVFIFDRNGKGIRKINRQGQGGEEYLFLAETILDEDNSEIFVNDRSKILVYDLFGNFKRSLRYHDGAKYLNIWNFDRENFICQNSSFDDEEMTDKSPFVIISKKDGSINRHIQISVQQKRPSTRRIEHNGFIMVAYTSNFPVIGSVIPYHNSWILTTYSNDTVFRYLPNQTVLPFMVRTPSIELKNAEAFLSPGILTERYYFLQTEKMEPEIKGTTPMDAFPFYPRTNLMYDRQENAIYEYTVYNDDFSNKMVVNIAQKTVNEEIAFSLKFESDGLLEAYEKGQLKGKLKEIASKLKEEDNPVIMLVKHKK
jgi:hypothetical protein